MKRLLFAMALLATVISAGNTAPQVRPVSSKDYQIGCYYFPGWEMSVNWLPIDKAGYPKPLLGYYQDGDPGVVDWQLKWAAEHGVNFFIYDWYWKNGGQGLVRGLNDGYLKAANRKYVKFCLLWANHNGPGSHSEQDFMNVTDYWIKNYFKRPEYFKVDGKPMVILFNSWDPTSDLGGSANLKRVFDKMRERVKAAGFPGLYLVASQGFDAGNAKRHKEEGWDAATTYNYPGAGMDHGGNRGSYQLMVKGYEEIWKEIDSKFQIPYMVPIMPGWDNTPWAGKDALVRYGSSGALFEEMCARAKRFMDERPAERAPRIVICEAWNEFGEGSYIEPTKQYGFSMLDAIRNVFTTAGRKHEDVTPEMVGEKVAQVAAFTKVPVWEFAKDLEGWDMPQALSSLKVENGCLVMVANDKDPGVTTNAVDFKADDYKTLEIRMKTTAGGMAQFFWYGSNGPMSETNTQRFDVVGDGEFHTYTVDMGKNPNWTGSIAAFRFDPNTVSGSTTWVDYIRMK